jgi:aminoglycoside phosphotransferase (APT) family kinase protein
LAQLDKDRPSEDWIASLRRRFPTEAAVDETLTRKLRARSSGPHKSQSVEQVTQRLLSFLAARLDGDVNVSDVRSLAGGSSKEQYAFVLRHQGVESQLVLRMRPAASIVETHPLREFQALAAVQSVVPAPTPYWMDDTGEELGQPAIIYSYCDGVTRPPSDGPYTPRQGLGKRYREILAPQFVRYFAELAKLDVSTGDLSAFDAPPVGSNAGVISTINWWERVWEEDSIEAYPLMTVAAHWLRANAPPIDHVSLLHQDFRPGNFLFDPADGRITAFLDWELVLLGDRHADLAYFLFPLFSERDDDGVELVGGLMTRDAFISEYERQSGMPVDPARLAYYEIFCFWRGLINSLATAPRLIRGAKTHQDIRVGWIIGTAPILLRALQDALRSKI